MHGAASKLLPEWWRNESHRGVAGQGRWQEAVPLLSQAHDALSSAFGTEYEALGEADFYLALKHVTEATEVNLADINESLIEVSVPLYSVISCRL